MPDKMPVLAKLTPLGSSPLKNKYVTDVAGLTAVADKVKDIEICAGKLPKLPEVVFQIGCAILSL
jgi:hypothetical protein